MGIRQLQSFIQKYVPNGYTNISLYEECEEFDRENDSRPILLIDLHGLLRPLVKDQQEIFCGIRHNIVYEKFDKFLQKLSQIAEIIFFNDGPVLDVKLPEWMKRQNEQYEKSQNVVCNKVYEKCTLNEIIAGGKELISPTSHLKIVEDLARKYGILKIAMNRECDAEMVQFACQNSRVLAILADDSDFLIYPGKWKYFSLRDMDYATLETREYNRKALREELELNDEELVLLSTLNGNDVISYDKDTFRFHKSLIQQRNNPTLRFPAIAQYIKHHQLIMSENKESEIAYALFRSTSETFVKKVEQSIDFYDINFDIPEITDETQNYCSEKSLNFVFSVLNHMPLTFTLNYFDQKRSDNYYESVNNLFSKQIGIILNDKSCETYKICSKLSHNDPEYSLIDVDPITPTCSPPPLIELLDRSQYPEHDKTRFDLLKWLIGEEKLEDVDLESIPQCIFLDVLVLIHMVNEGFIDVAEADIVLLSIKHVEDDLVPGNIKAPIIMHPRAFFISILFSKCHIYITRCLEVTGLKELEKTHNFDGVLFHNLFHKHIGKPFDTSVLLGDFAEYRYYAVEN